jgi:putative lipoprotein
MTIDTCGGAATPARVLANRAAVELAPVCYGEAVSRLIASLVAGALLFGAAPARARDDWFGRDKALHFGATFGLAGAGYAAGAAFSREPVVRFGVGGTLAMGAGIAKELYDRSSGGDPSLKDLTWDALGTASGLVTAWLIDRYLVNRR